MDQHAAGDRKTGTNRLLPLTLTAVGIVYGDIGTSPLYTIRECFFGAHAVTLNHEGMAVWREKLFVLMARNAVRATAFFRLPPERVVELGVQVEM